MVEKPKVQDMSHRGLQWPRLDLTVGGYRGLFTAQVLVELCQQAARPGRLDKSFDVFAGTSIGGFMACALAIGVPPRARPSRPPGPARVGRPTS